MVYSHFYTNLPNLINSIGQSCFYNRVTKSIKRLDIISNAKVINYPKNSHPFFLGEKDTSKVDELYVESAYLSDPIYKLIDAIDGESEPLILDDVVSNEFYQSQYYNKFYQQLGWENESNIIINIKNQAKICIVYSIKKEHISKNKINAQLVTCLDTIKSIIQVHERLVNVSKSDPIEFSLPNKDDINTNDLALTKREIEIIELILKGHSSIEIAKKCFISEGTVKNHRKNIYRKLKIKSQAELFHYFIKHSQLNIINIQKPL